MVGLPPPVTVLTTTNVCSGLLLSDLAVPAPCLIRPPRSATGLIMFPGVKIKLGRSENNSPSSGDTAGEKEEIKDARIRQGTTNPRIGSR